MSMLRTVFKNAALVRPARNFSRSALLCEESKLTQTAKPLQEANAFAELNRGRTHAPTRMEKTFLVWSGRYKSVAEVPKVVPEEAIEKARNKARIRIANYMMAATVVACIACIISGKRAAGRGESVQKMNMDAHSEYYARAQAANSK